MPPVEIRWWRGCPSWEQAIELVRDEMRKAGIDPETLRVREIRDDSEAARLEFPGSPTVLVDGRDVEDPSGQPRGLTCRVYRLCDGRVSPLPDRAVVRRALSEAKRGS